MKFNEILKVVGRFTQEQRRERERRLSDPRLQAQLEATKQLLISDIKTACSHGVEAGYRFLVAGPLSSVWKGVTEPLSVLSHNMSVKNPKQKRSYSDVPAAMVTELLSQWGKGAISTTKMIGNLSLALGRGTVLGARHTLGK